MPRRGAESTPRPKGRWVCEARRHALPACGSDIPRHLNVSTAHPVGLKNGREREREGGAGAPRRTGRMNREGEVCSLVTCGVHFGARRRARARRRCVPRRVSASAKARRPAALPTPGGLGRYWAAQWHSARAVGKRFRGCRAKRLYVHIGRSRSSDPGTINTLN